MSARELEDDHIGGRELEFRHVARAVAPSARREVLHRQHFDPAQSRPGRSAGGGHTRVDLVATGRTG